MGKGLFYPKPPLNAHLFPLLITTLFLFDLVYFIFLTIFLFYFVYLKKRFVGWDFA